MRMPDTGHDIADRPLMRKYKELLAHFITHRKKAIIISGAMIDFDTDCKKDSIGNYSKVEAKILHEEELSYLIRIWPLLAPRTQYILRAKYILEKSSAEIAHELKIKPDSVRKAQEIWQS